MTILLFTLQSARSERITGKS